MIERRSDVVDRWLDGEVGQSELQKLTALESAPLGPSDRSWMERLGCEWPEPQHEQSWLWLANQLLEKAESWPEQEEDMEPNLRARREFFDLFPKITSELFRVTHGLSRRKMADSNADLLVRPKLVIGIQRFLQPKELDELATRLATKALLFQRILDEDKTEREYPLLWTGPLIVKLTESWSLRNYKEIVINPPLRDGQFAALACSILKGRMSESALRQLDSKTTSSIEDLDRLVGARVAQLEQAQLARQALVARYLGMVVEVAKGCQRRAELGEIIAVGNLALTRFVYEAYRPIKGGVEWAEERQRFEREAVLAIMRSMIGYVPRYKGKTVDMLEAVWRSGGNTSS